MEKSKSKSRISDMAEILCKQGKGFIKTDVLGSYTGTPAGGERPVQDADDL